MPLAPDSPELARINAALAEWRQGDVALEEEWFVLAADCSLPLTADSDEAEGGLRALTTEVVGLVVVTQTCDLVRDCLERPYVEVSPIVEVSEADFHAIARGRRPAYAVVPAVADRQLVADLDRVMTVEKSVVALWARTSGCTTDQERRSFSQALARKRARVALPDDFTLLVAKLLDRLQDKHDKNSDEGRALRALHEVRVRAAPSWNAAEVEVTLWFIPEDDEPDFEGKPWREHLERWEKLIAQGGALRAHPQRGPRAARPHGAGVRGERSPRPGPPLDTIGLTVLATRRSPQPAISRRSCRRPFARRAALLTTLRRQPYPFLQIGGFLRRAQSCGQTRSRQRDYQM